MAVSKVVFLPKYSKQYMKHKEDMRATWGGILFIHFAFLGLSLFIEGIASGIASLAAGILGIYIVFAIYFGFVQSKIFKIKKKYGMSLGTDEVLRITPRGVKEKISYEVYEKMIQEGHYYYNKEGLIIGKGKYKLSFPYEEEKSAQRDVKDCYRRLQSQIKETVPTFCEGCGELYKEYGRSRLKMKSGTILTLVPMLGVFLVVGESRSFWDYLFLVAVCLVQVIFLVTFYSSAVAYSAQNKKIKKYLANRNMPVRMGSSFIGYLWYFLVLAVMLRYNWWVIF